MAELFVNQFIARFGVPDQGSNFESLLLKKNCQLLGVQKTRTSQYHPQSDGLIERLTVPCSTRLVLQLLRTSAIGISMSLC